MSYLNHAQDPRRRATAVVTVGAVHVLLAAGLVAGLTVSFEKIESKDFIGIDIPLPPPPPPDPTPPPPDAVVSKPVAPVPPIVLPPPPAPPIYEQLDDATEYVTSVTAKPGPAAPSLPPTPPPLSFAPKSARPSNNSADWITTNDYPRRPLVDGVEGSVGYRLVVGTNGRVASCDLTRPSGNRALDDATCRLITSRARFESATDESGTKVLGTYTGSVRWEIPD